VCRGLGIREFCDTLEKPKKKILEERGRENLKHGGLNKKGLSIVDKGLESHNTIPKYAIINS